MSEYEKLCRFVCEKLGFTLERAQEKIRKREYVFARQACFYLGKKKTKHSLAVLGAKFEKDHATVLHGIKTINNLIDTDRFIRDELFDIENKWDLESTLQTTPIIIVVNVIGKIRRGDIKLLSEAERAEKIQVDFNINRDAKTIFETDPEVLKNLAESLKNLA